MFRSTIVSIPGAGARLSRPGAPSFPNRRLGLSVVPAAESASVSAPPDDSDAARSPAPSDSDEIPASQMSSKPEEVSAIDLKNAEPNSAPVIDPKDIITAEDFPYKQGDIVTGKVVFSNEKGARIAIHGCERGGVLGWLPRRFAPYAFRSPQARAEYENGTSNFIDKGVIRKFVVHFLPDDMSKNGRGPVLACNKMDVDLMFDRLNSVQDVCKSMRETIMVDVTGAVNNGLHVSLFGINGFIPSGHVPYQEGKDWNALEDLMEYVGSQVEVSLIDVRPQRFSFIASMNTAISDKKLRALKIGSLVWCKVRSLMSYGAFLSIDGTMETALLHITNVSWHRVPTMEDVFSVGDAVRAVVIGMDDGFSRIAVSTRDLEVGEGEMLRDPQMVYENAEQGVQQFLDHVAKWEAKQAEEAAAQAEAEAEEAAEAAKAES